MAEQRATNSTIVWLCVAAAFGLSFGLGRWVAKPGSAVSEVGGAPLHDGRRYQVPVSMSQPKRGDDQPLVTVVEWCDLGGQACRDSEKLTAPLMFDLSLQVRHTFRHLPAAGSESSKRAHEFARVAFERGKFWDVRKQLLARPDTAQLTDADVDAIAAKVGMDVSAMRNDLKERHFSVYVAADQRFAQQFGVTAGPTYYVNGRRLMPPVTAERLERLVEEEAANAKKVLASGVTPEQLYEEITKGGLFEPPLALAKSQ